MARPHIISAFPGTGKSYLFKHGAHVASDSDSSQFPKDGFPDNYIAHIKGLYHEILAQEGEEDKLIFVSSHADVRKALFGEALPFTMVSPSELSKEEYLERYRNRGSSEDFVKLLDENYLKWCEEMIDFSKRTGIRLVILPPGQYLSNAIADIINYDNQGVLF